MRLISLFFTLASTSVSMAFADPATLWPGQVPGFPDNYAHQPHVVVDDMRITETSRATMRVFKADPKTASQHALIIFPGGGYSILAHRHEGDDVAKFFASKGVTCFVVCYRVSRQGKEKGYRFPGPLLDARQAIRHVRKNAKSYNIDPQKVGVIGFSAGGHLASMCATRFSDKLEGDPVSDVSVRPDFAALIYPVVSMVADYSHRGSRHRLLGKNATRAQMASASAELRVAKNTPPLFLVHNQFDFVSSLNSTQLAQAATRSKVPCELHLYPEKAHGFGMGKKGQHLAADWPELLVRFIRRH